VGLKNEFYNENRNYPDNAPVEFHGRYLDWLENELIDAAHFEELEITNTYRKNGELKGVKIAGYDEDSSIELINGQSARHWTQFEADDIYADWFVFKDEVDQYLEIA